MRWLVLLALVLPVPALALGPAVLDSPDLRQFVAGPMVYGGSEGVTCTFAAGGIRCTDGSTHGFATQSATVRSCEQQQGVWTDVGVNQACVTWDGKLQVHPATTTYIRFGNDLTNAAWSAGNGSTVTNAGSAFLISRPAGGDPNAALNIASVQSSAGETWTWSCIARPAASTTMRLHVTGTTKSFPLAPEWQTVSLTATVATGPLKGFVYPGGGDTSAASVEVAGCWLTNTASPGRPCFGTNAAGTTCSADVHTVSTTGFPTTSGKVRVTMRAEELAAANQMVLDGRTAVGAGFVIHRVPGTNEWRVASNATALAGGSVVAAQTYVIEVERTPAGTGYLRVNGVQVATGPLNAFAWAATAVVGSNLNRGGGEPLNGSITRLAWSTK